MKSSATNDDVVCESLTSIDSNRVESLRVDEFTLNVKVETCDESAIQPMHTMNRMNSDTHESHNPSNTKTASDIELVMDCLTQLASCPGKTEENSSRTQAVMSNDGTKPVPADVVYTSQTESRSRPVMGGPAKICVVGGNLGHEQIVERK
jgi:hypothetical protein